MAKRAPRGTHTRTDSVTVRISPRLKYGLELLARRQHRSVSAVVEAALNQALAAERASAGSETTLADVVESTWSALEAQRVLRLATDFPNLLSFEEEQTVELIRSLPGTWETGRPRRGLVELLWPIVKQHLQEPVPGTSEPRMEEALRAIAASYEPLLLKIEDELSTLRQRWEESATLHARLIQQEAESAVLDPLAAPPSAYSSVPDSEGTPAQAEAAAAKLRTPREAPHATTPGNPPKHK